ncbi:MAG: Tetracycline resistance protein, class C [Chlamydiae bacterium]|nr:Tetracycline resistance protein, class C [Chlamydiota bacterium]
MFRQIIRLIPLLFTVFIDSLGFGLVFPIFSPMLIDNTGGMFSPDVSLAMRGLVFGVLISTYCIGQFFGGPLLGALSDRMGRKKVLVGSMWVAFLAYIMAGFGVIFQSLFVLFFARLLGGVAAGSYAVAQSVIADLSTEKNKAKNFGLLGMAWGSGFVIGPYLGGKLAAFGYTAPFAGASLFCLVNAILLIFKLKESIARLIPTKINWFSGIYQIRRAFSLPHLRSIFIVMFIFYLGWGFFTEFSPVFLSRYFGFNVGQIANFYAWVGLWVALCQGILIRPLLKIFAPEKLLPVALLALGLILPIFLFVQGIVSLFWIIPFVAFSQALIFPTSATMVSNVSSDEAQGEVLGIYSSVQWAAIAISPLFSGSLVALYPHLPITLGSGCMLIASGVFVWQYRRKKGALPKVEKEELLQEEKGTLPQEE